MIITFPYRVWCLFTSREISYDDEDDGDGAPSQKYLMVDGDDDYGDDGE